MSATAVESPRATTRIQPTQLPASPLLLSATGASALALAFILARGSLPNLERLAHSYLVSYCFFLSISLGALFFVLLQHLTGARWSVVVRRIAELSTATTMPVLAVLLLPIIVPLCFGSSQLYEWNDATLRSSDALIQGKAAYLNAPFFACRCGVYFAVWIGISCFFLRCSVRQDDGEARAMTQRMRRYSGPAMMALGVTINFAAFDLLMSLDAHWFSTIFGVYFFAGCTVAVFAFLPIAASLLQHGGFLRQEITTEHYHDLAKLLFGFMFFWAYIAFSQYLLIWYANIPEETGWFYDRQNGGWQIVSLVLILGHFALPFFGLMSRAARRSRRNLLFWCVLLLAMHGLDLYWLVMPTFSTSAVPLGVVDLLCVAGVGSIWLASMLRGAAVMRLLPAGDPYLRESLAFHNA